eukprot:6194747-Pleurochrysis_carterae.AAC.3
MHKHAARSRMAGVVRTGAHAGVSACKRAENGASVRECVCAAMQALVIEREAARARSKHPPGGGA